LVHVKIIHLNTYAGNGGAGRACLRLNKSLRDRGINSEVGVNFSFGDSADSFNFSSGLLNKWWTAAAIILERIVAKLLTKPLPIPFSFPVFGRNISHHNKLKEADLIHVHWVNHAFLRPKDLAKLAKLNKPVVWTFHDSNAFTGGCHVRYNCNNYKNECGNCPVLKRSGLRDWSHIIWKDKFKAYQHLDFTIIAPSKWMLESVQSSKLLGNRHVKNIPNTLDATIFKPVPKSEASLRLNLPADKFILMSGFMPSRKDLHKGTSYLVEAIETWIKKYDVDPDKVELVVFGNKDDKNILYFPIKTTYLGIIKNDEKLALCYSAADVFIAPSLEDNLPNTVMESLSCGTPVVAFTTGGIPDMVNHLENGYLAEYRSSADLAAGINWVFKHPSRNDLNLKARGTIEDSFSEIIIAEQHIKLYRSLLSK
jgi:glycosyltransferase involved in cell wall biosynthesis